MNQAILQHTRRPEVRVGAVTLLAVAVGLVAWLLVRGNGSTPQATQAPASALSASRLAALSASVHHPVYWAGPKPGYTYEVTRTHAGLIYIRYLPAGVAIGAKQKYLTVGTYPLMDAVAEVRAIGKRVGAKPVALSGGGVAVQDKKHLQSVYVAYPGSNYEIEIFDPSPVRAWNLVLSRQVTPIGARASTAARATIVTVDELRLLASHVGHPVYWAGPQPGKAYEESRTSGGRIYVRYLPPGVAAGTRKPYLTVGTYRLANAFAAVKAIARRTGGRTFAVAGGAVAVVDPAHPESVYLAFPGSPYEIEVFDPTASRARELVGSGRIAPIR